MDAENTARVENSSTRAALLLLADGRLPSGSHAHSGGVEAAVHLEGVCDVATLEVFLRGRLTTAGAVASAFAAASCAAFAEVVEGTVSTALDRLDREFEVRVPSPALRLVSRRQGRQLLRTGRVVWPNPGLDELTTFERGPHQPVVFGAVAAAARLSPADAALAAAHDAVVGPATAAVRVLGLDPFDTHSVIARMGPLIEATAIEGARHVNTSIADLPSRAGPLLDVSAERHANWKVRLFAS